MACKALAITIRALTAVAVLTVSLTQAIGTIDQVNSNIDYGTFENPSANIRPRWRYWLPDASVNQTTVVSDIEDAVSKGAGGVELLGFFLYGGVNSFGLGGLAESDWATYGWGTPAWKSIQDAALQVTKEIGAIIDLPLGPNQGSGVPAVLDSDGLQWDLQPFSISIPIGGNFNGTLPGWGTGELVSASTGLVTTLDTAASPAVGTLASSSLIDMTSNVDPDGTLSLSFPSNASGLHYELFAYYLIHTNYHEQNSPLLVARGAPQSTPETFLQNGSLVWDHFSAQGAEVATNFWDEYLLTGNTAKLVREVGNYVWEDSQEFDPTYAWWTAQLPSLFSSNRGYDINKYLPAIILGVASGSIPTIYQTDEIDAGASHIEDYRQTLTEANEVYLSTVTQWARSIGVQYSAQVAYNLPLDMPAVVPYVNAPECESLGFAHNIDGYRQFSGAANLAGKRVISSEESANFFLAYQLTVPTLLWDVKRSVAGGVNAFVFHGLPFSGYYPNTTWPGFSTFDYLFSEQHGPRQPGWEFYKESFMDYSARTQWITQSGVPKVDLAFYLKATEYVLGTSYQPDDLLNAGYTYEYLSPDNFALPHAHVSGKTLASDRQAFSALIVRANDTITVQGATRIAQFAHNGLPIILTGGVPGASFFGFNATGATYVNETFARIAKLKNVHTIPYENLADSIAALGLVPRTQISSNGSWYTVWREVAKQSTTYVYIYNDATGVAYPGGYTLGNITFATTGAPFLYDTWTGQISAVTIYTQTASTTTISLELAGNQTIIIGFQQGVSNAPTLSQAPANSVSVSPITMQNGQSGYTVKSKAGLAPFTLGPWNLTVESWAPPADLFTGSTIVTNTSYTLGSLASWQDIPNANLTYVSGRGYYATTFDWPPSGGKSATGAVIDLGAIVHTAVLYVNGELLPPLDLTWAKTDIGSYLKKGLNTVEIVVSTTLGNTMSPVWFELRSSGVGAQSPPPALEDYGLLYSVVVTPYKEDTYNA